MKSCVYICKELLAYKKEVLRRDVFNAIADPTRRSILLSLSKESQNVNTLAERFDMSRQAVSLHIKYLQECNVISIRKEGRERYCSLEGEKLGEVAEWLEPFKAMWTAKLKKLDRLLGEMQSKTNNQL